MTKTRTMADKIAAPSAYKDADREHFNRVLADVRRGRRASLTPYAISVQREHENDMATIVRQATQAFGKRRPGAE